MKKYQFLYSATLTHDISVFRVWLTHDSYSVIKGVLTQDFLVYSGSGLHKILFYSRFSLYQILVYPGSGLHRILFYSRFSLYQILVYPASGLHRILMYSGSSLHRFFALIIQGQVYTGLCCIHGCIYKGIWWIETSLYTGYLCIQGPDYTKFQHPGSCIFHCTNKFYELDSTSSSSTVVYFWINMIASTIFR